MSVRLRELIRRAGAGFAGAGAISVRLRELIRRAGAGAGAISVRLRELIRRAGAGFAGAGAISVRLRELIRRAGAGFADGGAIRRTIPPLAVAVSTLALVAAVLAPSSLSKAPGGPIFVIPAPPTTKECNNVGGCQGRSGPWVVVPAHGVGTYLLRCPSKRGWLVGGTDARASSRDVSVMFDGQLGAPIGQPSTLSSTGAALLFHGTTQSGKAGSYQPIIGCIKLRQKGIRSTVSARRRAAAGLPGTPTAPPIDLHSVNVELSPPVTFVQHVSCLPTEKLVGHWESVAFFQGPPDISHIAQLVQMTPALEGNQMNVTIKTGAPLKFPLGAYPEVQLGLMCQS